MTRSKTLHHSYIIPDLVDAAVVREQAAKRLVDIRHPQETVVHYHKLGEHCNERCEEYRFDREGQNT